MLVADVLMDLAQPAEVDRFRYSKRPRKSARASTYNDAVSGNKIQSLVFHSFRQGIDGTLNYRSRWYPP
jgi:hypothetical protein